MILVIAGSAAGYVFLKHNEVQTISYADMPVKKGDLEVTILSTGVVQPENRLEIKAPIAGRVETVVIREGDEVRKGDVLAWMSSTERAAMLDAAQAKGPEELKRWESLYRPTAILAPINGTVIQKNVESGQTFTTQDAVFVMSDRLTVKAQVDETDIAQIKLKQVARIELDAYPGQKTPAHVDQIAFDAKTVNNVTTYIVDVLPAHTPAFMRSGMTANVTFSIASKSDVLTVPNDAIKLRGDESYVLLGSKDGPKDGLPPAERAIKTGLSDGKRTEILSGLAEGDIVLVPQFKASTQKSKATNPFSPMGRGRPH